MAGSRRGCEWAPCCSWPTLLRMSRSFSHHTPPGARPSRLCSKILTRQRSIDAECGSSAFGRRHNGKLHVSRDVSRRKQARDAGCRVLVAFNTAVCGELAAKDRCQVRLLCRRRVEEQCCARQGSPIAKHNGLQLIALPLQARNTSGAKLNSVSLQLPFGIGG